MRRLQSIYIYGIGRGDVPPHILDLKLFNRRIYLQKADSSI
jgi:hypothetical protein